MNADVLKGRWMQIRGLARQWWAEITDSELDEIDGRMDELVGMLQEKYGYARDVAQKEVDRRLGEYEMSDPEKLPAETAKEP